MEETPSKIEADKYFEQGIALKDAFLFKKALPLLKNASLFYHKLGEWEGYIKSLDEGSDCHVHLGQYEEALGLLDSALECARMYFSEHHLMYGELLASVGQVREKKGDVEMATTLYETALKVLEKDKVQTQDLRGIINNNLGLCWNRKGKYEKAITYYQKAIRLWQAIDGENNPNLVYAYLNMGRSYYKMAMYPEADSFF